MNSDFVREKTSQPAGLKPGEQARIRMLIGHIQLRIVADEQSEPVTSLA